MYELVVVIGELYLLGGSVLKVVEKMLFFYDLFFLDINR